MYNKETILSVLLNAEANRMRRNLKNSCCMYKSCREHPIDSHCFQRFMLEKCLSDEQQQTYSWGLLGVSKGIRHGEEVFYDKEHINKAGAFKGFCKNHDTKLFKQIEIDKLIENISLEEYSFLYAYRNLCYKIVEDKALLIFNEENFEREYSNDVIQTKKSLARNSLKSVIKDFNNEYSLSKYEELKSLYEKYIRDDGTVDNDFSDEFKIFTMPLELSIYFASMACSKDLGDVEYPISLGILPKIYNKPNLFYIIAHRKDLSIFDKLLEYVNSEESTRFIQNIVIKFASITMIHPMLYDELYRNKELIQLYKFTEYGGELNLMEDFGFDLIKSNLFSEN